MQADVSTPSLAVQAMAARWPMIDALVGGTAAMRAAGKLLLPQFPSEPDASYTARLSTATLFPAFARTTEVLASKPFSKPLDIENVPKQILDLLENIDGQGSTLHAFSAGLFLSCLQYGLAGVLVDYPPVSPSLSKAAEDEIGARPYFATYKAASILGWRAENGALIQLRLAETVIEPDGAWGEVAVDQVRVLEPGQWQVWRKHKNQAGQEEWALHDKGVTSLDCIPFVFFYGFMEGLGIGKPPLLDLAYLNVEHWQSSSDQQTILHTARVPVLFVKGLSEDDDIVVGAASAIRTTSEKAEVRYVEHSGAAIEAGRQSLRDLEDLMRQAGAELLVQNAVAVTATKTNADNEAGRSVLQRIAESFEESLEECLELMGQWLGLEFDAEVKVFKDYGASNLSDQSSQILLSAGDAGYVSPKTVFEGLKRRDIVPAETKWDEEQALIAAAVAKKQPGNQQFSAPESEDKGQEDYDDDGLSVDE
jgi:hypothetical protein